MPRVGDASDNERIEPTMAYGTGRVFLRGNTYWVQFSVGGRTIRESAATSERAEALQTLARRRIEEADSPETQAIQAKTVGELVAVVEQRYTRKKQASLPTARGHGKAWLAALGAGTKLGGLTLAGLTDVRDDWEDDEYAPATINRRLAFLKVGLRLTGLPALIDFAELRLAEDNVRDAYVSPPEFARLYAEAHAYDPGLGDFFAWLYVSGMRRGEAAQLTFPMLDTRRWVLLIPGRVQKHRNRGIAIDGAMRDILQRRLDARVRGCEFLFHRAGERVGDFGKSWKTLCSRAGIIGIRPHDLRRSAVTNFLEMGFTPKEAMEVTGHRTLSVFTRYQQVVEESFRKKLAAMPAPWAA
jgi:integrase